MGPRNLRDANHALPVDMLSARCFSDPSQFMPTAALNLVAISDSQRSGTSQGLAAPEPFSWRKQHLIGVRVMTLAFVVQQRP